MRVLRHLPLALVVGCACVLSDTPPGVRHEGTPAEGADLVLAAAERLAPCDDVRWRGVVSWSDEPFPCGAVPAANGCDDGGGCALALRVRRLEPATRSALAHEIGHYVSDACGLGWGEDGAEAWGRAVNEAAR